MSIELGENQRVTEHQIGGFRNNTSVYSVDGEVKVIVDELNIPDAGGVTSEVRKEIYKVREDGLIEKANAKTDFAGPGDAVEVYSNQRPVIETVEDEYPPVMEFNELDSDIRNLFQGNIFGEERKIIEKQRLPDGKSVRFLQDKKGIRNAVIENSESDETLEYRKRPDGVIREVGIDPSGSVPDEVKYKAFERTRFDVKNLEVDGRLSDSEGPANPNLLASNLRAVLDLDSIEQLQYRNNSGSSRVLSSYLEQNPERKEIYQQLASELRSLPHDEIELKESLKSDHFEELKRDFNPLREYAAEKFGEMRNEQIPQFVYSDSELEVTNVNRERPGIEDNKGNLWYVSPEATQIYGKQILDGFEPRKVDLVVDNSEIGYQIVRSLLEEGADEVNLPSELDY